ncbi:3-keto-5-aminohexanoate cleavage enzyme [Geodermatophilus dictyosporus]|uniref:3-keto-5-aminohexanoate cleavage enzyme n=1 Tax=Geodermatophilus dictyosporus TaxID=1523247 RepID=A0A1I5Q5K2_9ACTN|nr:3-keto-5-aminohexanoate cleavage protein [Geodermatophilus dictyosporus]SFP41644.1 3-keto-5-aminohexanoate cleavage enzyme [Geodermatophilus dictyosporus]
MLHGCLNGARRPDEHPALPVTPQQLAVDAVAVRAAGAGGVHLHVKDPAGADTLAAVELAAALTAVRAAVPGLPVGVTTGAWAVPDPAARVAAVRSWTVLPDTASVNWHEDGAGTGVPVQPYGEASSAWPALRCAARWELDTRIGLEGTLVLPDGSPAPGNAALVLAARSLGAV